jgi:hypothetical protein
MSVRGRIETPTLTQAEARRLWHYDPNTGALTWRTRPNGRVPAGSIAGKIQVRTKSGFYKKTHVIWLWVKGYWPDFEIDHRNRNATDNRWVNLRRATVSQNNANKGLQKNNKSGFKGVYKESDSGKWRAVLKFNKTTIHLGRFEVAEEAARAYDKAAKEHHGEFAFLNFPEEHLDVGH